MINNKEYEKCSIKNYIIHIKLMMPHLRMFILLKKDLMNQIFEKMIVP